MSHKADNTAKRKRMANLSALLNEVLRQYVTTPLHTPISVTFTRGSWKLVRQALNKASKR